MSNGSTAPLRDDIQIPIQPFCGTMGVATDDDGALDVLPPTKGAGNIDTRHLTAGATLHLPVYVKGALFSAGDCHAAQGDGEVCVTGLECPMQFSLRFNVLKGRTLPPWRYEFVTPPGSLQPRSDAKGYFVHTALGPDLMTNAKNAVRGRDRLARQGEGSEPRGRLRAVQPRRRPEDQPDCRCPELGRLGVSGAERVYELRVVRTLMCPEAATKDTKTRKTRNDLFRAFRVFRAFRGLVFD